MDELDEVASLVGGNERFFLEDVVDQLVNVGSDYCSLLFGKVEKVDRLRFRLAIVSLVFKDDSRWIVSQQELLEFHFKI